jgi:hypothetical protein
VESELGEVVLDQGRVEEARVLLERAHRHLADHDDILPASQARLQKLARHAGRSPEPLSSPEPARD